MNLMNQIFIYDFFLLSSNETNETNFYLAKSVLSGDKINSYHSCHSMTIIAFRRLHPASA